MTEVYYERVPLKAKASKQGVKVPTDVIDALGAGDRVHGIAVMADTLGIHVLHGGMVDAEALTKLGDGAVKTGERVVRKFISAIRAKGRHATA
jgi:hypothetical protein